MTTQTQGRTIGGEMDRRSEADEAAKYVTAKVNNAVDWFGRLLPPPERGGMPAEGFAALVLAQVRRQPKLFRAAVNDPESLLIAATDCAAKNLTPGEEYWFVPFDDKKNRTGLHVSGMPGYKGEIQMIYRSGQVASVHCEVAYAADHFRWRPTEMQLPEHEPRALSDEEMNRANLRWTYAWAVMRGGGVSQPVVFNRYQVMLRRDVAKTKDFWESVWEPEMWLKTSLHRLYDLVPHSAGVMLDLARAYAVAQERYPQLEAAAPDTDKAIEAAIEPPMEGNAHAIPARAEPPDLPPPSEAPAGQGGDERWARHVQPPERWQEPSAPPEPPAADSGDQITPSTVGSIGYLFGKAGWSGKDHAERRRVVLGVLAAGNRPPLDLARMKDLTEAQGQRAVTLLTGVIDHPAGPSPAHDLDRVYQAAVKQAEERAGGDE